MGELMVGTKWQDKTARQGHPCPQAVMADDASAALGGQMMPGISSLKMVLTPPLWLLLPDAHTDVRIAIPSPRRAVVPAEVCITGGI